MKEDLKERRDGMSGAGNESGRELGNEGGRSEVEARGDERRDDGELESMRRNEEGE